MDAIRRTARIPQVDRITNEEFKRRMGIEGNIIKDI